LRSKMRSGMITPKPSVLSDSERWYYQYTVGSVEPLAQASL
jgi:hypothetical protein